MEIPVAKLAIESQMVNPPRPVAFHVMVDGKSVAMLTFEEVNAAYWNFHNLMLKRAELG